jgi:PKD repeat protein
VNVFVVYAGANSDCSQLSGDCNQNEDVLFIATGFNYDFNCSTHQFQWDFQDGTDPAEGRSVTHRFGAPGQYSIRLLVTVNGVSTPITQLVKVNSGNSGGQQPPGAVFPFDFKIEPLQVNGVLIPHNYVFTAFSFNDATTTEYRWDFGDGTPVFKSSSKIVTHAYSDGADHTITLTTQGYSGNAKHSLSPPRRRSAGH